MVKKTRLHKRNKHNKSKKKHNRKMRGKGQIFSSSSQNREKNNNKFIDACIIGNIGQINELRDKVSNVSIGLFPAFATYNFHIIDYLIQIGADINYLIGTENEMEYIKSVKNKLSLKIMRTGGSLLMITMLYVATPQIEQMFYFILSLKPDVNLRSKGKVVYDINLGDKEIIVDDLSALMIAIISQNFYYVLPLIKNGADIYQRSNYYENTGGEIVIVNKNSLEMLSSMFKKDSTREKAKQYLDKMVKTYREYNTKNFSEVSEDINKYKSTVRGPIGKQDVLYNPDLQRHIASFLG